MLLTLLFHGELPNINITGVFLTPICCSVYNLYNITVENVIKMSTFTFKNTNNIIHSESFWGLYVAPMVLIIKNVYSSNHISQTRQSVKLMSRQRPRRVSVRLFLSLPGWWKRPPSNNAAANQITAKINGPQICPNVFAPPIKSALRPSKDS